MAGISKKPTLFSIMMEVILVTGQQEDIVFLNRGNHFVLKRRREMPVITC